MVRCVPELPTAAVAGPPHDEAAAWGRSRVCVLCAQPVSRPCRAASAAENAALPVPLCFREPDQPHDADPCEGTGVRRRWNMVVPRACWALHAGRKPPAPWAAGIHTGPWMGVNRPCKRNVMMLVNCLKFWAFFRTAASPCMCVPLSRHAPFPARANSDRSLATLTVIRGRWLRVPLGGGHECQCAALLLPHPATLRTCDECSLFVFPSHRTLWPVWTTASGTS